MKKIIIITAVFAVMSLVWSAKGYSQNPSDYLVCQDIGGFKKYGCTCGSGAGILVPTGHFGEDHNDISCTVIYHSMAQRMGIDVEVTQHSSSDSDKWLQHEVEGIYRNNPKTDNFLGVLREVDNNRIFTYVRGTQYSWISNKVVVDIRYTDLQKTKLEPTDVIAAYLQKFPSTIAFAVMDKNHDIQWIKDEMERRLWLCDKWYYQLQLGKVQQREIFEQAVKSMNIFLDYREKYYGVSAANEKNLLTGYLNANNGTLIKAKLSEYKNWWAVNREKAISL